MILKSLLVPKLVSFITSNWLKQFKRQLFSLGRRLNPAIDNVTFYLRVDDPHSYLLLQVLPDFLSRNQKSLEIQILLQLDAELNPEADKSAEYSLRDVKILANYHQLNFPKNTTQPTAHNTQLATAILLENMGQPDFLKLCRLICDELWLNQCKESESPALIHLSKQYGQLNKIEVEQRLSQAQSDLFNRGHYQSAMLYYGGEWYWGIDRLWHLEDRLTTNKLDDKADYPSYLQRISSSFVYSDLTADNLPDKNQQPQVIDFYFSFRSPYSYIAAQKLFKLLKQYPNITLNIKPVLPMVMRGLKVPKSKKMYIVHDAKREADRYYLPFGKIADPLGGGIERCMALFYFAKQQNKQNQLVDSLSRGIWAEGIDTSSNKGLRQLVSRSGLDWEQAKLCLGKTGWKEQAENNQQALDKIGLWGVPSFQYKSLTLWGQDRYAILEQTVNQVR